MESTVGVQLSEDYWFAYNTLSLIFQWLKPPDLLRCGQVCKLWKQIAMDPIFWRSVTLDGCKLNFNKMSYFLEELGSSHLKLKECIFVLNDADVFNALKNMPTLRKLELSDCSSKLIEKLSQANLNLEVIKANIICGLIGLNLNLSFLQEMHNITELRLYCNRELDSSLKSLECLTNLQSLYLLGVINLKSLNLKECNLCQKVKLRTLGLGDCQNLPLSFANDFIKTLTHLKKLRLENCRECYIVSIVECVSQLNNLECLELIEINVDPGFQKSLYLCSNLKKLTIVPNPHRFNMARYNTIIATGVVRLKHTLKQFTLGFIPKYLEYTYKIVEEKNCVPILSNSFNPLPGDLRHRFVSLNDLRALMSSEMIYTKITIECREFTGSVFLSE